MASDSDKSSNNLDLDGNLKNNKKQGSGGNIGELNFEEVKCNFNLNSKDYDFNASAMDVVIIHNMPEKGTKLSYTSLLCVLTSALVYLLYLMLHNLLDIVSSALLIIGARDEIKVLANCVISP